MEVPGRQATHGSADADLAGNLYDWGHLYGKSFLKLNP